jgi:hypothetical protein
MGEPNQPFVRRVVLRNYKSIKECDVSLGPLGFLVGPNGSGKSNFLDALRFLGDSIEANVQHAMNQRGELRDVFWRGEDPSNRFSIHLDLDLRSGANASYEVTIGEQDGVSLIQEERCVVRANATSTAAEFHVRDGTVSRCTFSNPPPAPWDQLYLANASGYTEFAAVHRLLRGMRFYNIDPQRIRHEGSAGKPARGLGRSGQGALFAAHRTFRKPELKARIDDYLHALLPTFHEVRVATSRTDLGPLHGTYATTPGQSDVLDGEPRCLRFLFRASSTQVAFDPRQGAPGHVGAETD